MLYLGLASATVVNAAPDDHEDGIRTGNILLRDFFLERYLALHGEHSLFPGTPNLDEHPSQPNDPMAEEFVNTQVNMFIAELEQKLGEMKSTVNELETIRNDAVSYQTTETPSARARVRELAQNVGERAGDLYRMVAMVAIDLHPKDEPLPTSSGADFFRSELRFLHTQVAKAEGRIKALFLAPTHTVDLDELRGDNVLTELKSIEQVSKDIKKKTDSAAGRLDNTE